jgi:glycerol-3-phosphate dehydrogenase (NAD(P)+)
MERAAYAARMAHRVAVIGAGTWGTTVASIAAAQHPTTLWARRDEVAEEVRRAQTNATYLPGVDLPLALSATSALGEALAGADVVVMAVPSHGFRGVLQQASSLIPAGVPVVSLTKGLEPETNCRMTEVVSSVLPGHATGILTGPNLAREIAEGQPAGAVLAFDDEVVAASLQDVFAAPHLRVYTNTDVVGCEIAGVVKNVIAIAAGMVEGLGFGDNTKATVITRGLAELARLGAALGGQPQTFAGLAGLGDLVATCASAQSRNHHVGVQLGRGVPLKEIVTAMPTVAEGVRSSAAVVELARRFDVRMPIAEQVDAVCHRGITREEAVQNLLQRRAGAEWS